MSVTNGHSGDGSDLASTLGRYDLKKYVGQWCDEGREVSLQGC